MKALLTFVSGLSKALIFFPRGIEETVEPAGVNRKMEGAEWQILRTFSQSS